MLKNSMVYPLEAKVAVMQDPDMKQLAEDYLNKARDQETLCANLSFVGYLMPVGFDQLRHHIDSMHSAMRCVRTLIKADKAPQDQTQT